MPLVLSVFYFRFWFPAFFDASWIHHLWIILPLTVLRCVHQHSPHTVQFFPHSLTVSVLCISRSWRFTEFYFLLSYSILVWYMPLPLLPPSDTEFSKYLLACQWSGLTQLARPFWGLNLQLTLATSISIEVTRVSFLCFLFALTGQSRICSRFLPTGRFFFSWRLLQVSCHGDFQLVFSRVCKGLQDAFCCDSAFYKQKWSWQSCLGISGRTRADLCTLLKCFDVYFSISHVFPQLFMVWQGFIWFQCNWFLVGWRQQTHPTRGYTNWTQLVCLWCKSAPVFTRQAVLPSSAEHRPSHAFRMNSKCGRDHV